MSEPLVTFGSAIALISVARPGGPWVEVHAGGDHRVMTPQNARVMADAIMVWLREHHPEIASAGSDGDASEQPERVERRQGERREAMYAGLDAMTSLLVWMEPEERLDALREIRRMFCERCGRVFLAEAERKGTGPRCENLCS